MMEVFAIRKERSICDSTSIKATDRLGLVGKADHGLYAFQTSAEAGEPDLPGWYQPDDGRHVESGDAVQPTLGRAQFSNPPGFG